MNDSVNLTGKPPDPLTFEGPLNVLIQLQGTAAAYVRTAEVKQAYDVIVPDVAPAAEAPPAEPESPPEWVPLAAPPAGMPISSGRRINPDPNKYVTDNTEMKKRLKLPG